MRARSVMLMAAMAALVGCGGEAAEEELGQLGFVLLDLDARQSGWQIEGLGSEAALLPASMEAEEGLTLRGPDGSERLEAAAGELLYVRGAEGAVERHRVGEDVSADSVFVVGTRVAAEALARHGDAEIETIDDGLYRLDGPGALLRLADDLAPAGLEELLPAEPLDDERRQLDLVDDARGRVAVADVDGQLFAAAAGARPQLDFATAASLPIAQLMRRSVSCADPVEGLWVARRYDQSWEDWHLFTFEVRRDPSDPGALTGRIRTRAWGGDAEQDEPSSCDRMKSGWPGSPFELRGEQRAEGSFDGRTLSFRGTAWRETDVRCATGSDWYVYRLDHFTGRPSEDGRRIDAVNNDGGRSFDEPHEMRRVGCL